MSLILKLVIIITTLPIFLADSDIALKNPEETILLDSTLLCEPQLECVDLSKTCRGQTTFDEIDCDNLINLLSQLQIHEDMYHTVSLPFAVCGYCALQQQRQFTFYSMCQGF
jgi:hypothetical protein